MSERALPVPENDDDRKMLSDIERVGWAVLLIPEDNGRSGFAFTIGLFHTYGHPEIILIGLPRLTSYTLVNTVGRRVRAGEKFDAREQYDDLIEDFPTAFEVVDRRFYWEYLGMAKWFYQSWDFPVLQMVWPDQHGHFPWSMGVNPDFRRIQPVLSGRID